MSTPLGNGAFPRSKKSGPAGRVVAEPPLLLTWAVASDGDHGALPPLFDNGKIISSLGEMASSGVDVGDPIIAVFPMSEDHRRWGAQLPTTLIDK